MAELNFDSGLKTFRVNDRCDISFNPTDNNFVTRLYSVFEELDKKQEKRKAEISQHKNTKEIFAVARKYDEEMREMIDDLFVEPICETVFGDMSTFALAGGLPVWANFLLAVMDEVDTSFAREQSLTNSRVSKYTNKYARK